MSSPESPKQTLISRLSGPLAFGIFTLVVLAAFARPLLDLISLATGSDMHSHTILIPFISGYLLYIQQKHLPRDYGSAPIFAAAFALLGAGILAWYSGIPVGTFGEAARLAILALAALSFIWAGGFLFLGLPWMRAAAFPMAFLVFTLPMPETLEFAIERGLVLASADVSAVFFNLAQIPFLRDGVIFQLPGITIEVAQECSGIRSTYVLFITSLMASYIFLQSPWRRALLVGAIIPLGIIRNGFRILVIAWLCVHIDPEMIHSFIHRRGGPIFFAISLVPLFLLLLWLRHSERKKRPQSPATDTKVS
jgi:exosortase C (VPDSG-CTERM-specific)